MTNFEGTHHETHMAEVLPTLTVDDLERLIEIWALGFPGTQPDNVRAYAPEVVLADKSEIVVARNPLGHIASAMVVNVDPGRDKRRGRIDDVATHPQHLR